MVVIRFLSKLFSSKNEKTLKRTLQQLNENENIQLSSTIYKESIQFNKNVVIIGNEQKETVIEGLFTIPKSISVTFQHVTLSPAAQIYVEGKVTFQHCKLNGAQSSSLVTISGGTINAQHCEFYNAADRAVSLMKNSTGFFQECVFHNNGKAHIELEHSIATVERCKFSHAKHAYLVKNKSFMQSEKSHLHHHSGSQIIVEHSKLEDCDSVIERGEETGIYVKKEGTVKLQNTKLRYHKLSQIWVQKGSLCAQNCTVQHGSDAGITLKDHAEATFAFCDVSHHQKANVHLSKHVRLNMEQCHIHSGKSFGIQASDKSIVNFAGTLIKNHSLAQLFISDETICSMKQCLIKEGKHVGLFMEKKATCTLVECIVTEQGNTAISVIGGQLTVFCCDISQNFGNGIQSMSNALIEVDGSKFYGNGMPHIAGKAYVEVTITDSEFYNGKSLYVQNHCKVFADKSKFYESDNVQIEISDKSEATFQHCQIYNGKSYGVKVCKNSNFHLYDSQISHHVLAQIVVNDSSAVVQNCELYKGCRNAVVIQNHSEVLIQDSFISKHLQSQIWIDLESTLELRSVQLTDGNHSDLCAQNQSTIYVSDSIIRNDKYLQNVRAVNFSKIELVKTIVENRLGDTFYSENNSLIKSSDI